MPKRSSVAERSGAVKPDLDHAIDIALKYALLGARFIRSGFVLKREWRDEDSNCAWAIWFNGTKTVMVQMFMTTGDQIFWRSNDTLEGAIG